MDSLRAAVLQVDWDDLEHAYGPASDAPARLLALVGDDPEARSDAVEYLDAAMLHQGSVCSATGPFVRIVAGLLADPRTDVSVADVLPWDPEPRSLRTALLTYLVLFAEACRLEIPDEELIRDAYPADRDEADLRRIRDAARACDWRLDPNPATRTPPPPALVEAANDEQYGRAMRARGLLACRKFVPDVFGGVLPLIRDADAAVRTPAMIAAVYCLRHASLGGHEAALVELLEDAAAGSSEPRERATVARLLGILGRRPESLLHDPHPGVRACAALAPVFAGDERATAELLAALEDPETADRWFEDHLPGQQGWLRFDLARALADRVDDLETILPVALRLTAMSSHATYEHEVGPWVRLAFPEPLTERSVLTSAQRAFLGALLANWHPQLPLDQDLCRALVRT
ncbi:HEAT repeat domain-containing protein [Actinoallomurus acaciae]|uniref:HEAT repeat domain-containing protein n=1 Tax=Actinoallomurus acaciae TaxID=502577 RepID=A0ABV5Y7J7_9ACTN